MLTVILLFVRVLSVNPIQKMDYDCKHIGKDLVTCNSTASCKFYEVSTRETWNVGTTVQAAIRSLDGATFDWYNGNVTMVIGEQITVSITGCTDAPATSTATPSAGDELTLTSLPCAVTESRYSFVFRDLQWAEFVGMRIKVWRQYFERWIPTNLTNIADDDWGELWAFGGEFGHMVGLEPFGVQVSRQQDCHLDPSVIPGVAIQLAQDAQQNAAATACTQVYKENLCSDDFNFNCEWNSATDVCQLNNLTNILLGCYNYGDETSCESDPMLDCRWLPGDLIDEEDSLCINSSASLSIMFLGLLMLLFC